MKYVGPKLETPDLLVESVDDGELFRRDGSGTVGTEVVGVPSGGAAGQVLAKASEADHDTEWVDQSGGGASAFTDLTDVPNSYTGQAGKVPVVNETETGLEFVDAPTGGGTGNLEGGSASSIYDALAGIDGGVASSVFGGTTAVDGGSA